MSSKSIQEAELIKEMVIILNPYPIHPNVASPNAFSHYADRN